MSDAAQDAAVRATTNEPVADERPARYVEKVITADGVEMERVVYRASSLGGCTRAIVAAARKFTAKPHPDWFEEVLDEGRRMEAEISWRHAKTTGVENMPWVDDQQWEIELEIGMIDGRQIVVRGHMDDLSEWYTGFREDDPRNGPRVREYKKFRDSTWRNFVSHGVNVNAYYPWQLSVYMHATGLSADFVGGHYDVETDSITETHNFIYVIPPVSLLDIKRKIAKVERLINEGYAPDETDCSGGYPCPFWYLHDPKAEPIALPGDDEELNQIVGDWQVAHGHVQEHAAMVKDWEKVKKAKSEELNTKLLAMGHASEGQKFTLNGVQMTRTHSNTPEAAITRKGYTTDYWTIKAKKEKKS